MGGRQALAVGPGRGDHQESATDEAYLGSCRLVGAQLDGVRLPDARLVGIDLSEASLVGAVLTKADLSHERRSDADALDWLVRQAQPAGPGLGAGRRG
jgi:uncharacterized protein YjbI with pentapeptide repeats